MATTVLDSFSPRIISMVYAAAADLDYAGTMITGNTGSYNILPLAPMGTGRNENALLSLWMEAMVSIPVRWIYEIICCCGCGVGSSEIRLGAI